MAINQVQFRRRGGRDQRAGALDRRGEAVAAGAALAEFHARHVAHAPALLHRLQQAVLADANAFEVLMDAVRCCWLGQTTNALFEVSGQYRRSR